jgi:hypothetical protein
MDVCDEVKLRCKDEVLFYYETGVCGPIMCPKRLEEHRKEFILESRYSNPNWNKVR